MKTEEKVSYNAKKPYNALRYVIMCHYETNEYEWIFATGTTSHSSMEQEFVEERGNSWRGRAGGFYCLMSSNALIPDPVTRIYPQPRLLIFGKSDTFGLHYEAYREAFPVLRKLVGEDVIIDDSYIQEYLTSQQKFVEDSEERERVEREEHKRRRESNEEEREKMKEEKNKLREEEVHTAMEEYLENDLLTTTPFEHKEVVENYLHEVNADAKLKLKEVQDYRDVLIKAKERLEFEIKRDKERKEHRIQKKKLKEAMRSQKQVDYANIPDYDPVKDGLAFEQEMERWSKEEGWTQ